MKILEEMSFEELVEWAEGHILKELIKGNLHGSVWTVCDMATRWNQKPKPKKCFVVKNKGVFGKKK